MQRLVWWVQWHRRLGAVVALLVIVLAVTGILINHSQSLGWHRAPVHASVLAWLYGIPLQPVAQGFPLADQWLTRVGEQLYLNRQPLLACNEPLLGAVKMPEMLAVLCGSRLLLLDEQGALIEELANLPAQARALGTRGEHLLLQAAGVTLAFDEQVATWQPVADTDSLARHVAGNVGDTDGSSPGNSAANNSTANSPRNDVGNNAPHTSVQWAHAQPLPEHLRAFLARRNPVPGLSREKVLLDLHSGRLFGNAGVMVVDLVGVAMCLLAFSGLLTWFGRKWRHRKRH